MPEEAQEHQELSVEDRARQRGWVPTEEWKGDPEKVLSAEEFLKRAEDNLPLLKSNVKLLERRLSDMANELKETKKTFQEFTAHQQKTHERELARLKGELRGAAETGDVDKFDAIEKEIDALGKPATGTQQPGIKSDWFKQPVYDAWLSENAFWFEEEPEMAEWADKADKHLRMVRPALSHEEHMAELTKRIKKKFPETFGEKTPGKKPAAPALGGGESYAGGPKGNGKKTYANLPDDAKKACDKFVKTIPGYTQDQYLKDYAWEE